MLWAGISVTERTDLHIVQGNMNSLYYRANVLQAIVLPLRNRVGDRFVLMDDNARPHRARIITTFLEDNNIQRIEWPAMSPDLNPIENIWAMLNTRLRNRIHAVTNVATLTAALQEEWNNIPQMVIRNTVVSMRRRCLECVNLNGAFTHY
jgi:transposase